jgi:hypothetical protein
MINITQKKVDVKQIEILESSEGNQLGLRQGGGKGYADGKAFALPSDDSSLDNKPVKIRRKRQPMDWILFKISIQDCGEYGYNYSCPQGHGYHFHPSMCHLRVHTPDARNRSIKWKEKLLSHTWSWPVLITLTFGYTQDLRAGVEKLVKCFQDVKRHMGWYGKVLCFAVLEIVYKGSEGYYLHIHCLVNKKWVDGVELRKYWYKKTGMRDVDIRRCGGKKWGRGGGIVKAVKEVAKYMTKPFQLKDRSDLLVLYDIYKATFAKKLVWFSGKSETESNLDTKEISYHCVCAICGSRLIRKEVITLEKWKEEYGSLEIPVNFIRGSP